MSSHSLTLLLSCLSLIFISGNSDSVQAASSFIRSKCRKTTFPALCIESLSNYATSIQNNPKQLAQTALSVSITRAQSSKAFVTKLAKFKGLKSREYAAIRDCLEEMADSVDRLTSSLQELKKMDRARGEEIFWHISNAQTWVSASLTDDNTCMDGFSGEALNGRIKASVHARMTNVAQVTSNALALINQYAGN